MKKLLEHKKILIGIVFIVLVLLVSSFSFAFYYSTAYQEGSNKVASTCFEITYEDGESLSLNSSIPLSEEDALRLEPYSFKIKNVCEAAASYDITIEDIEGSNMPLSFVRYKLNDMESNILENISVNASKVTSNAINSRTILSAIILPNEEKNYDLRLWIDENATIASANKSFLSKVILLSTLEKHPYNVITLYNNNGDSEVEYNLVKGENISNIPIPFKEGYTFNSWYSDESLTNELPSTYIPSGNEKLYASYTAGYVISYDATGGEVEKTSDIVEPNQSVKLPTPIRYNYTFDGWYTEKDGGEKVTNSTIWTKPTILYAHWIEGYKLKTHCNKGWGDYGNKLSCIFSFKNTTWDTWTSQAENHSGYVKAGTKVNIYSYYGDNTTWYEGDMVSTLCSKKSNFSFIMPAKNIFLYVRDSNGGAWRKISIYDGNLESEDNQEPLPFDLEYQCY